MRLRPDFDYILRSSIKTTRLINERLKKSQEQLCLQLLLLLLLLVFVNDICTSASEFIIFISLSIAYLNKTYLVCPLLSYTSKTLKCRGEYEIFHIISYLFESDASLKKDILLKWAKYAKKSSENNYLFHFKSSGFFKNIFLQLWNYFIRRNQEKWANLNTASWGYCQGLIIAPWGNIQARLFRKLED